MTDLAFKIMVIMAKTAFYSIMIFSLGVILTIISSAFMVVLNFGAINDIVGLVQMWLPFNLGVVILWILTVSFSFIMYRLALLAVNYLNAYLNT